MMTNAPIRPATAFLRVIYSLGLLSYFSGKYVASGGWLALVLGGSPYGGPLSRFVHAATFTAALFRIYQVARYPQALEMRVPNKGVAVVRWFAVAAMLIAALAMVGFVFVRPITLAVFGKPGDANIGFFVVSVLLVFITAAGCWGCLIFEITRLAVRQPADESRSKLHWRQDGMVMVTLLATCLIVPSFLPRRADVSRPSCETSAAGSCVSHVEGHVRRMIGLEPDTAVQVTSSILRIDLVRRAREGTRPVLSESLSSAVRAAGFEPVNESAPVRLSLEAQSRQSAVELTFTAFEDDEETARYKMLFNQARLVEGRLEVVVPDSVRFGTLSMTPGERGESFALNQLFALLRQAVGTPAEAATQQHRLLRTVNLSAQIPDNRAPRELLQSPARGRVDPFCAERVASRRTELKSGGSWDLGWPLLELVFDGAEDNPPAAPLRMSDAVICKGDDIWIIGYHPLHSLIQIRRYSPNGELQRFVESHVPVFTKADTLAKVDLDSVREINGHLRFDRVVGTKKYRPFRIEYHTRQTFEIAL